jgi:hypothetical protein
MQPYAPPPQQPPNYAAPPQYGARRTGTSGAGGLAILLIAAGGFALIVLPIMLILGIYGVRKYLDNARAASARQTTVSTTSATSTTETVTTTTTTNEFSDAEGRIHIRFPSAPTVSRREMEDGKVILTMATLETGPTQFASAMYEVPGIEAYDCKAALDGMRDQTLKSQSCKLATESGTRNAREISFECPNRSTTGAAIKGLARFVCDASDVKAHHRGLTYSALYFATTDRYSEPEGKGFLAGLQTK